MSYTKQALATGSRPGARFETSVSAYPLSDQQFDVLRSFAHKHAGIFLGDHKKNMVQRRVSRRIASLGMRGFGDYCEYVNTTGGHAEFEHLINVLTTNKTDFFREQHHFEHLAKNVLPDLMTKLSENKQRRLRIWSAGCSSGQEPYSIAMTLRANCNALDLFDARILATDIDTEILSKASEGVYDQREIEGVPQDLRGRFLQSVSSQPGHFCVTPDVQSLVAFRHLNLHANWPMSGTFDAIFCRNTVIYFDKPTQRKLFDRFADILAPQGVIYIGHSESLYKVSERFQFEGLSTYRKTA